MKKAVVIIISIILAIAAVLGVIKIIMLNTFIFEYSDSYIFGLNIYDTVSYNAEEMEELEKNGEYLMRYPDFDNSHFHIWYFGFGSYENNTAVYTEMNCVLKDYVNEIAEKYNNYAKLDYTVDIDGNKTVTVNFYGYGCFPEDDTKENLNKTFVFDISNASPKNPPRLISEM